MENINVNKEAILKRIQRHEENIKTYMLKLKESETVLDSEYYIKYIRELELRKNELGLVLSTCFE
jgi:hypothetical protein